MHNFRMESGQIGEQDLFILYIMYIMTVNCTVSLLFSSAQPYIQLLTILIIITFIALHTF